MKVEEGQHVTKGELLYTLSTPELNAKLQQAEAVKSAASAMDQKALTGARIQQKEAALNLWEKAQAGLLLAQKTFDRVNNLYEQGVVPAQKLDEARANLQAMQATERAAKAQCELVGTGYPVVAILDMSDVWVTFNIKEDLMPDIHIGTRMTGYIPALDRSVEFEVTYIAVQADFATWSATRTQGGFDIRTFAVKAKPTQDVEYIRPGMSVLVNWKDIAK